jgi:hypothetical protein
MVRSRRIEQAQHRATKPPYIQDLVDLNHNDLTPMSISLLSDGRGQRPERVGEKASDGTEDETGDGDRISEPEDVA